MAIELFEIAFHLPDEEAFAENIKRRAAVIDDYNQGSHQAEYTFRQAVVILFHEDGFDSLLQAAKECRTILGGWSVQSNEFPDGCEWVEADA